MDVCHALVYCSKPFCLFWAVEVFSDLGKRHTFWFWHGEHNSSIISHLTQKATGNELWLQPMGLRRMSLPTTTAASFSQLNRLFSTCTYLGLLDEKKRPLCVCLFVYDMTSNWLHLNVYIQWKGAWVSYLPGPTLPISHWIWQKHCYVGGPDELLWFSQWSHMQKVCGSRGGCLPQASVLLHVTIAAPWKSIHSSELSPGRGSAAIPVTKCYWGSSMARSHMSLALFLTCFFASN